MFTPTREYWTKHGCLRCLYRNGWQCMLNTCYLENSIVKSQPDTDKVVSGYDCASCPYKKNGGCHGYCIKKVLEECKEIWEKNKKWRQKNG